MTEAEWLACSDLQMMLRFLTRKARRRKLRLFACGCARYWQSKVAIHGRDIEAIDGAEQAADGLRRKLGTLASSAHRAGAVWTCHPQALEAARYWMSSVDSWFLSTATRANL